MIKKDVKNIWPSWIWYVLTNKEVHSKYGDYAWRFLPLEWRMWWKDDICEKFPDIYNHSTFNDNSSFFVDLTNNKHKFNVDVGSFLLPRLATTCNDFLIPTVNCSWGCSKFMHKCGKMQIDVIFQRYLQQCSLKMMTLNKDMLAISAQEDFLSSKNEVKCWLFNPRWKIMPSIAYFDDDGSCV